MTAPPAHAWLRSSLLERLTDHQPTREREPAEAQQVDTDELRRVLLRDLSSLFNTTRLSATVDLSAFPEVARSVLNYGLPDLTRRTLSSMNKGLLAEEVLQALLSFESRLVRETVEVEVETSPRGPGKPAVLIRIEAVLRAEPLPIALRVLAEVDLESGRVTVGEAHEREED